MYIFIELKSREETSKNKKTTTKKSVGKVVTDFPSKGRQYNQTVAMMGNDTDFLYVYMSTHDRESFSVGRCVELNRKDTFYFLGPIKDIYSALRGSVPE